MRFGIVILPQTRWREQADLWRRAEAYGFDHAWTYDHLTWDPLAEEPWGATVPTLVAAATVTTRIGLGPWVSSPNFRHPVPFARDLNGLDDVSDGRTIVAVGAGTPRRDGRVLGAGAAGGPELPPGERAGRLEEFVDLLDRSLRQGDVQHDGTFYQAVDARTVLPGPSPLTPVRTSARTALPRPPLVVAASGPRLIRLAARYDGWATTGPPGAPDDPAWWDGVRALAGTLDEALTGQGGGDGFRRMLSVDAAPTFSLCSAQYFVDVVGRADELGFTDVVAHWPRPGPPFAGSEAVLDEVAELLPGLH